MEVSTKSYLVAIVVTEEDLHSHSTKMFDKFSIHLLGASHLNNVVVVAIPKVSTPRIGVVTSEGKLDDIY